VSCDDYCWNHGCNQGRDCPARVAKVGQRYPANPEPLRPTGWRHHLKDLARAMLLVTVVMLLTALALPVFL